MHKKNGLLENFCLGFGMIVSVQRVALEFIIYVLVFSYSTNPKLFLTLIGRERSMGLSCQTNFDLSSETCNAKIVCWISRFIEFFWFSFLLSELN